MNKKRIYIISSTLLLIGLFAGVVQYVGMFDALYAAAVNPGHSWSQMECSTALCIDTVNSRVGIGTKTPQANLDIAGNIKLGGENIVCNNNSLGIIRYWGGEIAVCNGLSWKQIVRAPIVGTFTDSRDGQVYGTVILGGKVWMTENLRYSPSDTLNPLAQVSNTVPYYYVYGAISGGSKSNYSNIIPRYGLLYNHAAALTACPSGWRLSTDSDWISLETYLGMPSKDLYLSVVSQQPQTRGTVEGMMLKSKTYWSAGYEGIDSVYFNAPPSGYCQETSCVSNQAIFWGSTSSLSYSWTRGLSNNSIYRMPMADYRANSVRCVKDL